MNSNKYTTTKNTTTNLIGEKRHRDFLQVQADYGYSQRGGVLFPFASNKHSKRLVSDINILNSTENKHVLFSQPIYSN